MINWPALRELREGTLEGRQCAGDPKMEVSSKVFGRMVWMTFTFLALQLDSRNSIKCLTAQWDVTNKNQMETGKQLTGL